MYKKEIFLEIDANLHQPIQSMEADSNSRSIRFYLTSNYIPFKLTGKKVIFKAVKPDGTDIVNDCQIIDVEKGIVETEVTKQLNAVPGKVKCQLSILGENDYVLKTKKFAIFVDSKLNESGVVSSKEYKTLENALSKVHEIDKNFEQVNAKINEVATKGTTVEVIESATKKEIDRQIADGTLAHLMIEDGGVTPEKTSFYSEIESHNKVLKNAGIDYTGTKHDSVKKAMDANVDWLLGEVNTTHHEGQHITATDTIEGHAKSAILKGQTLVNMQPNSGFYVNSQSAGWLSEPTTIQPVEGRKYFIKLYHKPTNLTECYFGDCGIRIGNEDYGIVTAASSQDLLHVYGSEFTSSLFVNVKVLICEYQEGMENWDIPYFEGMSSVKMPVLTTSNEDGAKTNILTVNEPVELRGIGNVKDELNLLTGEVTQRIGEVILNGETTEDGHTSVDDYIGQYTRHISELVDGKNEKLYLQGFFGNIGNSNDYILTNGFLQYKGFRVTNEELEEGLYRYTGSDHAYICISASRFTEHTFEGIKKFLSENPQSYLVTNKESVVKTVVLSDNVVYSYDEVTHYDCSSEDGSLVPTLSVDVPTNLPALVSRQRATIETQKEQIQTLEIENEQLIAQNEIQDEDIALNQDAINFMLFATEMSADENNKAKGVNTMAAYLANQILKGKLDYTLVVARYPQFKEDIDTILILEGEENLIK